MSRLSSKTLFHYVSKKEHITDILQHNFRPRYVKEYFHFETGRLQEVAIPMLCFCDIALSSINEHAKWYGSYGIGMKHEWALEKGLTPVHYYNPQSYLIRYLSNSLSDLRVGLYNGTINPDAFISNYFNLWFMKPYEGKQYSKITGKTEIKKFYDEKEWRFIPSLNDLKELDEGLNMSVLGEELVKYETCVNFRNHINKRLGESINLDFTPQDISYIIINNEDERHEIIEAIKQVMGHFTNSAIELVISKIISLEQVLNDF